MGRLPDLRGLFAFALIGIVVSGVLVAGIGLWAGVHMFHALKLYVGF